MESTAYYCQMIHFFGLIEIIKSGAIKIVAFMILHAFRHVSLGRNPYQIINSILSEMHPKRDAGRYFT